MDENAESNATTGKYTVVARRYRPKTFAELVGQSTVSQALVNAIQTNRVGHAYLFTGARGVGKTSTARIFAKALNAAADENGNFDPNSDIAQAIDAGDDMDVIEIDGASNRGIDEIRQLRANASIRPSRSKYKIYIIDEVHMLTTQAFNALLKTLEEPPAHVKFIFCTTDPEKMPITVLSRCQRFDFPPVQADQILGRLKFICESEGRKADEDALQLVARRAAGSMRDSQSLLEQLLSFGGEHIKVEDVHAMLGTADETRLAAFASKMIERDAASALKELDDAVNEGVDAGQITEQLLGYLRDMMVVTVGCTGDLVKTANPNSIAQLKQWGETWGVASLMAAIQILDDTIVKMRHSVQSRVLMEIALVQICQLQDLQALSDLVRAFASGQPVPPPKVNVNTQATIAASSKSPDLSNLPPSGSSDDSKKKVDLATASVGPATTPAVVGESRPAAPAPATLATNVPAPSAPASPPPSQTATASPTPASHSQAASHSKAASVQKPAATSSVESLVSSLDKAIQQGNAQQQVSSSPSPAPIAAKPPATQQTVAKQSQDAQVQASPALDSSSAASATSASSTTSPGANGATDELSLFKAAAEKTGGLIVECANMVLRIQGLEKGKWKAIVAREGGFAIDYFNTGDNARKLSHAISELAGLTVSLEFHLSNEPAPNLPAVEKQPTVQADDRPAVPQSQLIRNAMNNPLVKQFVDMFEGQVVRVDRPMRPRTVAESGAEGTPAEPS